MNLKFYHDHVDQFQIIEKHKSFLKSKQFVEPEDELYLAYPRLFFEAQSSEDHACLEKLSVAGFLYYKSLLRVDRVVDQEIEPSIGNLATIILCQEESLKLLTELFGTKSAFWLCWNRRRTEYIEAFKKEKVIRQALTVPTDRFESYCDIADGKSAIGKIAIDVLYFLNKIERKTYEQLLVAHAHFSVALQLIDDVSDFWKDIKFEQFNWAVYQLEQHLGAEHFQNINWEQEWKRYYYASPVSLSIYDTVIEYFNKALSLVQQTEANAWQNLIKKEIWKVAHRRETIKALQKVALQKSMQAQDLWSVSSGCSPSLAQRTDAALHYLLQRQRPDGAWEEYLTQGGISTTWSTAFILQSLDADQLPHASAENALRFLQKNRQELWSYNSHWGADADSTNFVFSALLQQEQPIEPAWIKAWLDYQKEEGGFSTYTVSVASTVRRKLRDPKIKSLRGWTQAHPCVSAVSYWLMSRLGMTKTPTFQQLENYLFQQQNVAGLLEAYWWTSPIYSSVYWLLGLTQRKKIKAASRVATALVGMQNADGSFGDAFTRDSPFYTALALWPLLNSNTLSQQYKSSIEQGINYLKDQQYTDGSWPATHALRIPSPEDIEVKEAAAWRVARRGGNIRAEEFSRLFTTATCHRSLSLYQKRYQL